MQSQARFLQVAFAVAVTAVVVFNLRQVAAGGEGIGTAGNDGATCGVDDQVGSESIEPSSSEDEVTVEQLEEPLQLRSGSTQRTMRLDRAAAAEMLKELPSAEELRKSLEEEHDLSEFGGESPRAIAADLIKGLLDGDEAKVITAYDLTTKEGILVAMTHAAGARIVKSKKQLYATVEKRFGEDGLTILAELEEGDVQGPTFRSPLQTTDVPVDEALDAMEIYYTEDRQKALAKLPGGEPIELHQRDGRWYASASTEDAANSTLMYAWILLPVAAYERQTEIAEKAENLEQLRQELRAEKDRPLLDAVEAKESSGSGVDVGDDAIGGSNAGVERSSSPVGTDPDAEDQRSVRGELD